MVKLLDILVPLIFHFPGSFACCTLKGLAPPMFNVPSMANDKAASTTTTPDPWAPLSDAASPNVDKPSALGNGKFPLAEDSFGGKETSSSSSSSFNPPLCGQNKYTAQLKMGAGITFGTDAMPNQFPWLVRIETALAGRCNGVIVDEKFILTAAYCVNGIGPDQITIYFGDHLTNQVDEAEFRRIPMSIYRHPAFNLTTAAFNFALVRLGEPLDFSKSWAVQKVCLPSSCSDPVCLQGSVGSVAGWGQMENGQYATALKTARMPIVGRDECLASWKTKGLAHYISDTTICAGILKGPSLYWNDDGAALMVKDAEYGLTWACGIHGMFMHNAGDKSMLHYSTFSRVCSAMDWIQGIMTF